MFVNIGLFRVNISFLILYLYLICTVLKNGLFLTEFVPRKVYKFYKLEHFNTE
ncbi:MAG: hypothetical protein FD181_2001 [Prolixibacteraceae bacterium]|nr:MAG: hypothetical protein FD181_2001 [Prolixibacteraceae bacterium]